MLRNTYLDFISYSLLKDKNIGIMNQLEYDEEKNLILVSSNILINLI